MAIVSTIGWNNVDRKRSRGQLLNLPHLITHPFYRHGMALGRVRIPEPFVLPRCWSQRAEAPCIRDRRNKFGIGQPGQWALDNWVLNT